MFGKGAGLGILQHQDKYTAADRTNVGEPT